MKCFVVSVEAQTDIDLIAAKRLKRGAGSRRIGI
jgi:hypothetical protein